MAVGTASKDDSEHVEGLEEGHHHCPLKISLSHKNFLLTLKCQRRK